MKNYSFGRSFCWEYAKQAFLSFENRLIVHFVSHEDVFPFNNLYETPKTLGIDGWFCIRILQYLNVTVWLLMRNMRNV
jgi:hypothetical protein